MARDYGHRRSSRSRGGAPHPFLVITVTFLLGYLTASVFDVDSISRWLNTQVLAHQELKKATSKPEVQQAAIPPKPKFEFYTLLANEKVPAVSQSGTNTVASAKATAVVPSARTAQATVVTSVPVLSSGATAKQPPLVASNSAVEKKPVSTHSASGNGNYLVQVASFKARQDAEHMKGLLILKGFNVYIVPVTHASKGNWFRVVVGPYPNKVLAQKAQSTLAKNEHLHGMVTGG